MRRTMLVAAMLTALAGSAAAQAWEEYVNMDERFGVNFPAKPVVSDASVTLPSGATLPARLFRVVDGPRRYSVTVVNYAGASPEMEQTILKQAAEMIRKRGGTITYDGEANYEGMDTQMLQITNADGSRSFIAITQPPETSKLDRIYIVEGVAPAGAPVPGLFQQSLSIRDIDGQRMRYSTDVDGVKFRVIPDSGGQPYLRRQCAPGLPCATREGAEPVQEQVGRP